MKWKLQLLLISLVLSAVLAFAGEPGDSFRSPHYLAAGRAVGLAAQSQRPHRRVQSRREAARQRDCEKRIFSHHSK